MQVTDKNGNIFGPHGLQVNGSDGKPKTTGGGGGSASWGGITGTLSAQTDLQTALNGKEPSITAGTASQYYRGDKTFQTLDKTAVGLGNVDNTSDANKPVSTATSTALNGKQPTLVSGTNIKTVNGNSLVGSGDVSINGITSIGSSVGITVSGTTTGIISGSVLIPAGTISEGQNLMIRAKIRKISGTGNCIARLYINTTNSTTGALQIGQSPTLANNTFTHVIRDPHYTNLSLYTISVGAANFHDLTSQTTSLISFNPAVDYYLFVVLFNSTTLDVTKTLKLSVLKYD